MRQKWRIGGGTDNLVYKVKCLALRVWGSLLVVVNATGHLRQHPNEAGGGFEVALLRRRLVEMWLLMEFSSSMCV